MEEKIFKQLNTGDVIRHAVTGRVLTVSMNMGCPTPTQTIPTIIACDVVSVTNPKEWDLVLKHDLSKLNKG